MNWLESRINVIELSLRQLQNAVAGLTQRVGALEQAQWASQPGGFGGGGSSGVFFCMAPSSGSWGATGTWPALTPGSFTADVYQVVGTQINFIINTDIYNWYPASPAVSKVLEIAPDGSGSYVTVAQSCT